MKYNITFEVKTRTGNVIKPAKISLEVEADSREEAMARFRSAAARIVSAPMTLECGDSLSISNGLGMGYYTRMESISLSSVKIAVIVSKENEDEAIQRQTKPNQELAGR